MLEVQEITSIDEFRNLRTVWNETLEKSSCPVLYLTFEWMYCWWKCLGKTRKNLYVLVVRDGEDILGIAPFMEVKDTIAGLPTRKIEFISMMKYADHPSSCAGTLDLIIVRRTREVYEAVFTHLMTKKTHWNFLRLHPIPRDSQSLLFLEEIALNNGFSFMKRPVFTGAYIPIEMSWQSYFARFSSEFRRKLRQNEGRLSELAPVKYLKVTSSEEIDRAYHDMIDIERRSWKWKKGITLTSVAYQEFYRALAFEAAKQHWLRIWFLESNGQKIAFNYAIQYGGAVEACKWSYDESFRNYAPGRLLEWRMLEDSFQDGATRINLLWGDLVSKGRWSPRLEERYEVFLFNRDFYSRVLAVLMLRLSLYRFQRAFTELGRRIARKFGLRLRTSELTRMDQVKSDWRNN
jgi:CelD/BcsL family acetyltransferase involved in cellulose biosynthesis